MAEFLMPKLGADMSAGTLVSWRKKSGDAVQRGDIVAEVETEKGVIEVEIFRTGVLDKILVQPGEKVPVGTPLAIVRETGETPLIVSPATVSLPTIAASSASPQPTATLSHVATSEAGTRLAISPSARRLARELGIDPATVQGTGHHGAITHDDIQHAAESKAIAKPVEVSAAVAAAPSAPTSPQPLADRAARMRQTIAAAMSRSKREIPHYYLSTTIDMQRALSWLNETNLSRPLPERLLYGVLLLKAAALALREVPELNALWVGDRAVPSPDIHVGAAISLRQGGLIAPALHHTDRQSLGELMKNFRDLIQRARAGTLRSSELADPTITVTSLGEQGVETVFGIIYPPQVAIVGFGKVVERPWSVEGQIVSRPLLTATLSGDHRVTDGHRGGLYLAAIDRLLQEPSQL